MTKILTPFRRGFFFLVLIVPLMVALADWLFYKEPFGWTLGLFLFVVVTVIRIRGGQAGKSVAVLLLTVLLYGLCLALVHDPDELDVALAVVGVVTLAIAIRSGWESRVVVWINRWFQFCLTSWIKPWNDFCIWTRVQTQQRGIWGKVLKIFRLWFLPFVFAIFFILLFAQANPIIDNWMESVKTSINDGIDFILRDLERIRVILWIIFAWMLWALLRARVHLNTWMLDDDIHLPEFNFLLSAPAVFRGLILFNVIFAVQSVMDVSYLWGGKTLPEGMTFAEYAHRGSYPLVGVAFLSALFILVTFRPKSETEKSAWTRKLVYLWLLQNVGLIISAAWRLLLYVEIYSLSRFRVAAAIWMLLVGLGLLWIMLRILRGRSNSWLLKVNCMTLFIVLYICSFVHFRGMIAWYNVKHCSEVTGKGVEIDLRYLEILGPSALPAASWLEESLMDVHRAERVSVVIDNLEDEIKQDSDNWRSWSYKRQQLRALLSNSSN